MSSYTVCVLAEDLIKPLKISGDVTDNINVNGHTKTTVAGLMEKNQGTGYAPHETSSTRNTDTPHLIGEIP